MSYVCVHTYVYMLLVRPCLRLYPYLYPSQPMGLLHSYSTRTYQSNSDLITLRSTVPYLSCTLFRYVWAVMNSVILRGFWYATSASRMASISVLTFIVDCLVTNHRTQGHSMAFVGSPFLGSGHLPSNMSWGLPHTLGLSLGLPVKPLLYSALLLAVKS